MAYEKTYDTISKVYSKLIKKKIDAYLIGGISAPIQTNTDLYRQNEDLDIMVSEENVDKIISELEKAGYIVSDKRGIKTENYVDEKGQFHPMDHELNADTKDESLLGIGIFVYKRENGIVTLNSYAYEEKEKAVIGSRKEIPEELFDLMYSDKKIKYHGSQVMTSSKEYTYLTKMRGKREKDKLDASILEPFIDDESKAKIERIKKLEKRVKRYKDRYNDKGEIESTEKMPELEDTFYRFISDYENKYSSISKSELLEKILKDPLVLKIIQEREDVSFVLEKLKDFTSKSKKGLAEASREIAHIYCYSDDFNEEYSKYVKTDEERHDLISGLENLVVRDSEYTDNISSKGKEKTSPYKEKI